MGTDGYATDMFESIKVANLLQKHELHNPQAGWEEVFQMAFKNNREIATRFFGETLGVIQTGAPADVIVVNYYPPTPITSENAYFCKRQVKTHLARKTILHLLKRKKWLNPPLLFEF